MMQGFSSQLIPNEVGTDIAAPTRTDIPDLTLDQNFTNQSSINYVNVSVPPELSMSRNYYSTVSLPQNIVGSIDQQQESLSTVYVHPSEHMLDKSLPIPQPYSSSVGVGGILSIGPVVTHPSDSTIAIGEVSAIPVEAIDKSMLLKNLKLSFTTRTYESMTYSEIPAFLSELIELRKVYNASKEGTYPNPPQLEEIGNPLLSQIPLLLEEYKNLVQNLRKCYQCPTCNKSFTTRFSLNTHVATHSDIKPYECPHAGCGKCFRTKSALSTHINITHAESKQHVCNICGKSFAKIWLLRQHQFRHNANHRYSCPRCNASFAYPYQLKEHELTKHEGIKPYVCSYEGCGKQFNSKNTLRLHELAHTRPFVCSICYKQFGYACDLKRHEKKAHAM